MDEQAGTLYLVPTPIGNLDDITQRALLTLKQVDLIAAEDTRHTGKLLSFFDINTPQISLHEHNFAQRIPQLIAKLKQGQSIAQVSDAGTPSISDPGFEFVQQAIEQSIKIVPLPGPSAFLTGLIASGITPQPFTFLGFLPRKTNEAKQIIQSFANTPSTLILYESPHRISATIQFLSENLNKKRKVVLARELTKKFEEFIRGTFEEVAFWLTKNEPRGEFVVIIEPYEKNNENISVNQALELIQKAIQSGQKMSIAVKEIAKKYSLDRNDLYQLVIKKEGEK